MKSSLAPIRIAAITVLLLTLSTYLSAQHPVEKQATDPGGAKVKVRVGKEIFTTRLEPRTLALPAETEAFQFSIYGAVD